MNNKEVIIEKKGAASLMAGQFARLDNKEMVLQITKGSVEIYAVKNAGSWRQQKKFLFVAAQGETIFSPSAEDFGGFSLIITASAGADFQVLTRESLLKTDAALSGRFQEDVYHILRKWLEALVGSLAVNDICSKADAESAVTILSTEKVFPASTALNTPDLWQPVENCHKLAGQLLSQYFSKANLEDNELLEKRRILKDKLLHSATVNLLRSDNSHLPPVADAVSAMPMLESVKVIAAYLNIPADKIRTPVEIDTKRQDIIVLKNIAKLAGMQIRQVKLEPLWHQSDVGPLLTIFGPENKPAALIPVSPRKYQICIDGVYQEVTDEIAQQIPEDAYVFYAGLLDKTITAAGFLKFIFNKCWRGDFRTLILTGIVAGIIATISPFVTQTIFEDIIPVHNKQGHLMVVQVMIVSSVAAACVGFAQNIAILRLKSRSLLVAESALWLRFLALPVGFFRKYQSGDLVERMTGVTKIASFLSTTIISTIFNSVFSFFSLMVMIYYSWKLALAAAIVWGVYLGSCAALNWRIVYAYRHMVEAHGKTAGKALQIINGLTKFRLKKSENQAFHLWACNFGEQWQWNRTAFRHNNRLGLITSMQSILMSMLIFWIAMYLLENESSAVITQPDFIGFYTALGGLNVTVIGITGIFAGILEIIPLVERLKPILEAEPEVTDNKAEAGTLTGRIEINNVSFRYAPEQPPVLRNISIAIPPGQFAAIVGASGSGKSTLIRLMLGFEKPEAGSIYYDGQDISELNISSIRSQMGVVLQNGQLMSGDIYSNIIGSLPLTQEDAWEAAEMVGLAEDIRKMPMGMHTVISEGAGNISGGQRQRILIARAIVHRPRIIFFDEATSALDNRTQAIVTESISKLEVTRIIVAHRLSTVIDADVIHVVDKGQVVESGNYNELMAKNGLFAALAKRQML